MDEPAIDKAGEKPIVPMIDAINAADSKAALAPLVARLQSEVVAVFFGFGVDPDFEDSKVNIADVDRGGLGLPDRLYYGRPKDDANHSGRCSVDQLRGFRGHLLCPLGCFQIVTR